MTFLKLPSNPLVYLSLFFFASFFASSTLAQTRIYYTEQFRHRILKNSKYFRELTETDSGVFIMEMCNDTLMAKGVISKGPNPLFENDFAHFVRSFGNPYQSKSGYAKMSANIDYYQRGIKRYKYVARSGKVLCAQQWSKDGKPLLVNGTGVYDYIDNGSSFHQSFKDSVLIEMYEVRRSEGDTLYYTYDSLAAPKEGYNQFSQGLAKILKYPGFARLVGKEGIVYVQFVIDKDGTLSEFKPLTREGFNLERNTIDMLSKMPKWKPAIFRGKPVKMRTTIPVRFHLTY